MTVPMMQIGIMRMAMHERLVPVPMAVRLAGRIVRCMRVLMVLVMRMPVLVLHRIVHVLMFVTLSQMHP